ncbi:type II toxin-antitoxin system VapC family toxin [Planctomicrobium piriforme]|uniref:PIN domain nuclease, a component of toxin-antitoxin system (PIN domain) n=1 Tax=Planctomicrobium piriforme TaxID=1576369 RepID=A0A1I3F076_9PLAN|nr:type II toxin-antitoxin system VapC family toxin [Planctomicrobium piriforme]SFI04560.1 PIN domain nuclease, a component of toxin-antitoxin system (PIN domain) [Planctomicrobium piriforme]
MRILLDTHVFLWYITADPKLPSAFQAAIQDSGNEVFLSAASVWEAVIKHRLGKLNLPNPPEEYLPRQRDAHGIASLSIEEQAMPYLAVLPALHRDPFDRIIIAQALQHGLTIASVDLDIARYPAALLATT